ncbi:hypothetical protein BASA60_001602 [Batrachochytrium salamandrivorans]|nr:hypothetical protein BASA60_001602 [Batrachochytrium salamandrivorans]
MMVAIAGTDDPLHTFTYTKKHAPKAAPIPTEINILVRPSNPSYIQPSKRTYLRDSALGSIMHCMEFREVPSAPFKTPVPSVWCDST